MIIGIDLDDTIVKTSLEALKRLKEYAPNYNNHRDLPPNKYKEFMTKYVEVIMENEELFDGVKEAFDYLNSKGYKVIFITARNNTFSENIMDITTKYLKKNGFKYDSIVFNQNKKGSTAKENNVDIFIDDKEEVLEEVSRYGIECIRFTNKMDSKFKTFNNWDQIIEYLKSKEG